MNDGQRSSTRPAPGRVTPKVRSGSQEGQLVHAMEWRVFARMLYHAAGSPPVTGYSPDLIKRIMWDTTMPEGAFFAELLTALEAMLSVRDARATHGFAQIGPAHEAEGPHRMDVTHTASLEGLSASGKQPAIPLNPAVVDSVEGFLTLVRLLLGWRKMSLRELEERAKAWHEWMPKSTVSDMFRGTRLPTETVLQIILRLCEVPTQERKQWLNARNRLALTPRPGPQGRCPR